MSRTASPKTRAETAILIVNGGREPRWGRWLELCVSKIQTHSAGSDYRLYVWNNNVYDAWVAEYLARLPDATLLQADPAEQLAHLHAVPLQRLYERARSGGARYIVTMDSDAHPVGDGWLAALVSALDQHTVLAGVWRDEFGSTIRPYIHASCLCTTVDFIERNGLRLDFFEKNAEVGHDTLSCFTDKALDLGLDIHKLHRSNRNQLHRLIGGIYGDLIYHHGAGSRDRVLFWDELPWDEASWSEENLDRLQGDNHLVRERAEELLFCQYERYVAWLRGQDDSQDSLW